MKSHAVIAISASFISAALAAETSDPVCIVGAGPSGLTAAKALEDIGRDVIIFEKRSTVGGKCQSYYDQAGNFYPLGAVLFTESPSYAETYSLVNATGVSFTQFLPTEEWTFDLITGATNLSETTPQEVAELAAELARYTEFWEATFSPVAVPSFKNGVPAEFAVSGQDWFILNNYTALAAAINREMGDLGYGPYTEIPALYYLQSDTPDIMGSILQVVPSYLVDFHEVFTRFATSIQGPIHLGAVVEQIDRTNEQPSISYRANASAPIINQSCSDVIVAFPPALQALSAAGLQLSVEETALFSQVVTNNYFASAVQMDHLASNVSLREDLPNEITPYTLEGQPVYLTRVHADTDILSVWSMDFSGAPASVQTAQTLLPNVLSKLNKNVDDPTSVSAPVTEADVLGFSGQVDYFPHVGTAALLAGWYDTFNSMQGQQHTYYVSGLNNFEFVEYAIRAAKDLVSTHF